VYGLAIGILNDQQKKGRFHVKTNYQRRGGGGLVLWGERHGRQAGLITSISFKSGGGGRKSTSRRPGRRKPAGSGLHGRNGKGYGKLMSVKGNKSALGAQSLPPMKRGERNNDVLTKMEEGSQSHCKSTD